jgi:hypothetical protein
MGCLIGSGWILTYMKSDALGLRRFALILGGKVAKLAKMELRISLSKKCWPDPSF